MTVTLEALTFNHDPASAAHGALNLRRNASEVVDVPEWRRTASVHPEDSPAAYAIRETLGNRLFILGKFRRTDPQVQRIEVRAVGPDDTNGTVDLWLRRAAARRYNAAGNVLGEVAPTSISFPASGETGFERLELHNVGLWSAGVGAHVVTWVWQYRLPGGTWTDFATSSHRIYILLQLPQSPWQQNPRAPTNTQLPWTDVLDYACEWAAGAQTLDDAAARVTRHVYDLGPQVVEYDCPGDGYSWYSYPDFDCRAFLELLRGGPGNGMYVNCSDCATVVSTFANVLGCELWQSRMGDDFDLNPILAIGSNTWQPACGWTSFTYHEVGWKGGCTASEKVFDACLEVNGNNPPTGPPYSPLLPTNLTFGNVGAGEYRDRLATPGGRPKCNPQPGTRQHRRLE